MANPQKAQPGQKAIDSGTWNSLVDMLAWWKQTYALQSGSSGRKPSYIDPCRVVVKNGSGSAFRRYDVLGLKSSTPLTNAEREAVWLDADKLTSTNIKRNCVCAVLLDPLPNGAFGPAQVFGVGLAYVNVQATWHRRAYPAASSDVLYSGLFGPLEILVTPAGTGERLCYVGIGHTANRMMEVKTTSSITAAVLTSGRLTLGSGTATVYAPYTTAAQYADASQTVTIYNKAGDAIDSGKFISVTPADDWLPLATIEACTAPV